LNQKGFPIMPNRIRGEVELIAGGRAYRLLLTLGALAEIEDGLGISNLSASGTRLKNVRAGDLAIVAAALLRGGGHDLTPADVLRLPCELGALVAAVSETFAAAGLEPTGESEPTNENISGERAVPFAGTTGWRSD
jgi:hypothetical protein